MSCGTISKPSVGQTWSPNVGRSAHPQIKGGSLHVMHEGTAGSVHRDGGRLPDAGSHTYFALVLQVVQ